MYWIKKKYFLSVFIVLIFCKTNAQNLIPYRDNNLWGFCDTLGKVKIKPQFSQVNPFSEGLALVQKNKKYSYCDEKGILKLNFCDTAKVLSNKYIAFLEKGKWGVVYENMVIVKPTYEELYFWQEIENRDGIMVILIIGKKRAKDYTIALNAKKKPIIQSIKNEKLESEYIQAIRSDYENDLYLKIKDQIDSIAKLNIFDSILYMSEHASYDGFRKRILFYKIMKAGYVGIMRLMYNLDYHNLEIQKITPIEYQNVSELEYNGNDFLFIAKKNNKVGILKNGDVEIIPFNFDEIKYYDSRIAITIINKKYGCKIFNTVYPYIENKYDDFNYAFQLDVKSNWIFLVFKVLKNNKIGYVGENGVEYFKD